MIGLRPRTRTSVDHASLIADTWMPSSSVDANWTIHATPLASRTICAAEGCAREPRFWKRTARPVIDGQWCCSKCCAEGIVQSLLQRHRRPAYAPATHRHRIPLGLVLLEQGTVTYFQLRQALDAQQAAGYGRIGEWLDELCGVSGTDVTRALARQWNRPVLTAAGCNARQMALVLPEPLREELRMRPVRVAGGKFLYVAFEGPVDPAAEAALSAMTGLQVESGLLPDLETEQVKRTLAGLPAPTIVTRSMENESGVAAAIVDDLFAHQPISTRVACVRGTWWLRMFLEPAAMSNTGALPASSEDVLDVLYTSAR